MEKEDLLFDRLNELFLDYDFNYYLIVNGNVKGYDESNESHRLIKGLKGFFDKLCVEIEFSSIDELGDIMDILNENEGVYVITRIDADKNHLLADFSNFYDSLFNGEEYVI